MDLTTNFNDDSNLYEDMSGIARKQELTTEPDSLFKKCSRSTSSPKKTEKRKRKCTSVCAATIFALLSLALVLLGVAVFTGVSYAKITSLESQDELFDMTVDDFQSQLGENSDIDSRQFNETLRRVTELMDYFADKVATLNVQLNETNQRITDFQLVFERNLTNLRVNFESQISNLQKSINATNVEFISKLSKLESRVNSLNETDRNFRVEFDNISNHLILVNNTLTFETNNLQSSISDLRTSDNQFTSQLDSLNRVVSDNTSNLKLLQMSVNSNHNFYLEQTENLQSLIEMLNSSQLETEYQLLSFQNSVNINNTVITGQLNTLNGARVETANQIDGMQHSISNISATQNTFSSQISNLQASVNSLTASDTQLLNQLNTVTTSNANTFSLLNIAWNGLNATNIQFLAQLNSLQTLVNFINSSAILNENCQSVTSNCSLSTDGNSTIRWISCQTPSRILSSTAKDVRCQYVRISGPSFPYLETTPLHKIGNQVHCQCNVLIPSTNGYIDYLPTSLFGQCSLVMTVCVAIEI